MRPGLLRPTLAVASASRGGTKAFMSTRILERSRKAPYLGIGFISTKYRHQQRQAPLDEFAIGALGVSVAALLLATTETGASACDARAPTHPVAPGDPLIRHPSEVEPRPRRTGPEMGRYFVADAAEKAMPAVVNINISLRIPGAGWIPAVAQQMGSGFIISEDGLIVTNAHVVANVGPEDPILVTLSDGSKLTAKIHSWDTKTDVALIKVDGKGRKLPVATIGQSSNLRVGEWVLALGSPAGLANTCTVGIVSCNARLGSELGVMNASSEYIQTDAAINMGNSGGPLVNLDGEVVGINTLKLEATGIGFAIPIDTAWQIVEQLKRYKRVRRPYVGLSFRLVSLDLEDEVTHKHKRCLGMYVLEVKPGSPAEKGGLKEGDVIIEADGTPVTNLGDIADRIGVEPGKTISFKVMRQGLRKPLVLKVTSVTDERVIRD